MNNITKNILGGIIIAFVLFLMWYFSTLVIYTLIAGIISIVGRPVVRFFDKIRFRKHQLPHFLSALLTLIVIVGSVFLLASIFARRACKESHYAGRGLPKNKNCSLSQCKDSNKPRVRSMSRRCFSAEAA